MFIASLHGTHLVQEFLTAQGENVQIRRQLGGHNVEYWQMLGHYREQIKTSSLIDVDISKLQHVVLILDTQMNHRKGKNLGDVTLYL